jgi:hypothetical protein
MCWKHGGMETAAQCYTGARDRGTMATGKAAHLEQGCRLGRATRREGGGGHRNPMTRATGKAGARLPGFLRPGGTGSQR